MSVMSALESFWYLEHVTNGKKLILQTGENVVGRHSSCKFVLKDYEFLSRKHAKFIVSRDNIVSIEQMNALNGIFINETKLDVQLRPLISGDIIGLGIEAGSLDATDPSNHAIFQLKQMSTRASDIVVISDDEDIEEALSRVTETTDILDEKPLQLENTEIETIKDTDANNKNASVSNMHRTIHLPKLSDVKKEIMSQASNNIKNIFGEPDEDLLESVFKINPYVFNQLNNNNIVVCGKKIHDGDIIELPEDPSLPESDALIQDLNKTDKLPPAQLPLTAENNSAANEVTNDDIDDDDENFALSQSVLREMKEEMTDIVQDLCDLETSENNQEEDYLPEAKWINRERTTKFDDDEIIVIEDEDDELYSKVVGWSSKLLTQNLMSPVYPQDKGDQADDISNVGSDGQLANDSSYDTFESPIVMRRKSKSLRIESSDDDEPINDSDNSSAQKLDTSDATVAVAPTDSEIPNNQKVLEVELVYGYSVPDEEINNNIPKNIIMTRKRNKTISEPSESRNRSPAHVREASPLRHGLRLRSRSKSSYIESPLSSPTQSVIDDANYSPPKSYKAGIADLRKSFNKEKKLSSNKRNSSQVNQTKSKQNSAGKKQKTAADSSPLNRSHSCDEKSALSSPKKPKKTSDTTKLPVKNTTAENEKEVESSLEVSKAPAKVINTRLRSRAQSCYMERPVGLPETETIEKNKICMDKTVQIEPVSITESPSVAEQVVAETTISKAASFKSRYAQSMRKPMIIDPPHLPKYRGKLRGVSATSKDERKDQVPERQKLPDYNEIKEKRREELRKLADKSKADATADQKDDRKRKTTRVPSISNSNRGSFLTKEISTPTAKKSKLDNPQAKPAKPELKRRATIESLSQQPSEADVTVPTVPRQQTRPPERKDAKLARSKRTCNRVTFADMEREFALRLEQEKLAKSKRHVRFNDTVQIILIERVEGANLEVGTSKDTTKISLSTYAERRSWSRARDKQENLTQLIIGDILNWANQWIKMGKMDVVAESGTLLPIPSEFKSFKEYKNIFISLMKLELLTTIEREYKAIKSSSIFAVQLETVVTSKKQNQLRYVLHTRYNQILEKKFDLYTISGGHLLEETFASLRRVPQTPDNVNELCFEILQEGVVLEMLSACKTLIVRPVLDNICMEMGAFSAIHLMGRSPLFHRILKPCEYVLSYDSKLLNYAAYKGYRRLDDHQMDICRRTWSRLIDDSTPSITLIDGAPGTGKSVVISNLALQCTYGTWNHTLDRKILICAHSNASIDNITAYLKRARQSMKHSQFELLRFGVLEKIDPSVRDVSLISLMSKKLIENSGLSPEEIESLVRQQKVLEAEIADIKKLPNYINFMQQFLNDKEQQLCAIKRQLSPQLSSTDEHKYYNAIVQSAHIVCTTLSCCVKLASHIDYFDICIIDEATQCTESWTLLPLRFGVRGLILVGDAKQMPATVLSKKAVELGLGNSMFARIHRNLREQLQKPRGKNFVHTKIFKLSKQYRMHPEIYRWPNNYFYENLLVNAKTTHVLVSSFIPYCVINLAYTCDTNDVAKRSITNVEEARFVAKLLIEMDKFMPTKHFKYGIITSYSNHCYALKQLIPVHMNTTPQTVDTCLGQEKDIIILSNARTRGASSLANYQHLMVAITRPRRNLIICGNFDDLKGIQMWSHLLDDARKRGVYFDLERDDIENLQKSLISKILIK